MRLPVMCGNAYTCDIKVSTFLCPWAPTGYSVLPILHFMLSLSSLILFTFCKRSSGKHTVWVFWILLFLKTSALHWPEMLSQPERTWVDLKNTRTRQVQQSSTYEIHQGQHVHKHDEMFVICSLPVFILVGKRARSTRRGGRIGVDVFVVLVLFLSKGLLILERGAKIPENQ